MSLSEQYNIGPRVLVVLGSTNLSISQTSNTAATTQDGLTIDRNAAGRRRYYSCKVAFPAGFVSASSQRTASLAVNIQHSSDGTSWDTYTTGVATVYGTSSTGGYTTDFDRAAQTSVNLNGARRYVRVQIPAPTYADCSSGQGAFTGTAVIVFGGADEYPAQ
jgi:hypothetical protein